MSLTETYSLAHTAHCKLKLAADRPDRNLRFILGHAFTLDKLRLRLAEIEMDSSDDDDNDDSSLDAGPPLNAGHRRVSFRNNRYPPSSTGASDRKRSPPPYKSADSDGDDSDSGGEDVEEDDDEADDSLSLRRFAPASARPPQMVDDDSSSSSDEDEPKSSPPMPTEAELQMITEGAGNLELEDLYNHVAGCSCHGEKGPAVSKVWEIPGRTGHDNSRVAVVEVRD